jgi:hypothetical protein
MLVTRCKLAQEKGVRTMRKYVLAALCLLLISMGMVSSIDATKVEITNPQNEATISKSIDIEGTSKDISVGQDLWIMIYPHGANRYYPQDKHDLPIVTMANGDWSAQANIGSDADSGLEFKIFAVLADEKANKAIIDYLDQCKLNGSWLGMEKLPDGAMLYDEVSVTRK